MACCHGNLLSLIRRKEQTIRSEQLIDLRILYERENGTPLSVKGSRGCISEKNEVHLNFIF